MIGCFEIPRKMGCRLFRMLAPRCRKLSYRAGMILFPRRMLCSCPCCGMKFHSFVPGFFLDRPERYNPARYEQTRQDVICPCCGSLPRHRILACWCEEHRELLRDASILYFAPEASMTGWLKRNGIPYTTADLFRKADLKLNIQGTGLPDESWDVVVANHVLELVDDFRIALKEVYRILKPKGIFICSFPMDPQVEFLEEDPSVRTDRERYIRYGQVDHRRVFGIRADKFLTEAGFMVEPIKGEDDPDEILPVVGPADYDMNCLFCCRKR